MCGIGKGSSYRIDIFPKPFASDKTPYVQSDFTEIVKNICSTSVLRGLEVCKVIVLGDVGVGKTCLVNRFCRQAFSFNHNITIGVDFEFQQFDILNVPFNMQIWDTAGQEQFRCIAAAYYRSAHVVVTVCDFANIESLHHSLDWLNEALKANAQAPLKFLVGTKMDLPLNSASRVDDEASKIAKSMGAEYWIVSSKTGEGIKELFCRMAALSFERILLSSVEYTNDHKTISLKQSLTGPAAQEKVQKKGCKMTNAVTGSLRNLPLDDTIVH